MFDKLGFLAALRWNVPGWGMVIAIFGFAMLEFVECRLNVSWHRQRDVAFVIIPIQCDTATQASCPISGHLVVLGQRVAQVICVFFADALDTKVINHQ